MAPATNPGGRHETRTHTPLTRRLRHGRPSLRRLARHDPRLLADRPAADEAELLCLVNIMQQLDHLSAHPCAARRTAAGAGPRRHYFHVAEAQAYLLDRAHGTFAAVRPEAAV